MGTIKETRIYQYNYHGTNYPYINDWKHNPYTFLKARFYMEASAILVYFMLKTKIKPNSVTIAYGFAGIIGGILLSVPCKWTIIVALFIFFTKGILDWSDGHLARATGQTSLAGHILDVYGARLNDLGFKIGLGFYVAQKAHSLFFFYLIPLIPFLYAGLMTNFCYPILFKQIGNKMSKQNQNRIEVQSISDGAKDGHDGYNGDKWKRYLWITVVLDDRARFVDLILLIILIEVFWPPFFVTYMIFGLIIIKDFLIFAGKFYLVAYKGWAEKTLEMKLSEINNKNPYPEEI